MQLKIWAFFEDNTYELVERYGRMSYHHGCRNVELPGEDHEGDYSEEIISP